MLNRFKRQLAGVLLIFGILAGTVVPAQAVMLDRVLVVVNDDIITMDDLENAITDMRGKLRAAGEPMPGESELKKQVLEQLVLEKLLYQRAIETGVNIGPNMLDNAVEKVARQNNLSANQLMNKLESEGISADQFREELRKQLLVQAVIDRDIKGNITVLDSEVDGILRNLPGGQQNRVYNISTIQFAVAENASAEEMERVTSRANDIRSRLIRDETSFASAAKKFSSADNAAQGGELGWKTTDQLPDLFANTLKKMNKGEISEPLKTPAGIYLLKLNDLKGSQQQLVEQTRARHILLKATNKVDINHAKKELLDIRKRVLSGEDFASIATEISQDTASAIKGGELGWLSPGDTVAAFQNAMDALEPGEISQPVVSQFGVHLIEVEERRSLDVSEQQRKNLVREQVAKRKIAEKYDQYMKQLKSWAYIDYRVPLEEIPLPE
jgi:peptidyl-prolyl cis-trans isomerase SurA